MSLGPPHQALCRLDPNQRVCRSINETPKKDGARRIPQPVKRARRGEPDVKGFFFVGQKGSNRAGGSLAPSLPSASAAKA